MFDAVTGGKLHGCKTDEEIREVWNGLCHIAAVDGLTHSVLNYASVDCVCRSHDDDHNDDNKLFA